MLEETKTKVKPAVDPVIRSIRRGLLVSLTTLPFWIWIILSQFAERTPLAAWTLISAVIWLGLTIRGFFSPARHGTMALVLDLIAAAFLIYASTLVTWLLVVPALLHLMAVYFIGMGTWLHRQRQAAAPAPKPAAAPSSGETMSLWIKENLEAIVIAFIMALVIRCFCIEVFKIPSSSMEPTLLGDVSKDHPLWKPEDRKNCEFSHYHVNESGDRIMVTKFYYVFNPVERFDVVVFKFPLNQSKNFIKRVVGLPDEALLIKGGNIYTCPGEEYRFYVKAKKDYDNAVERGEAATEPKPPKYRIARKPLRIQESLWIEPRARTSQVIGAPVFGTETSYLSDEDVFNHDWKAGALPPEDSCSDYKIEGGQLKTLEQKGAKSIQFDLKSTPTSDGRRVGDVHIAFTIKVSAGQDQIFAQIVNEFGTFTLTLSGKEASSLYWDGHERKRETIDLAPIRPGLRASVDLMVYDGLALAKINGKEAAKLEFIATTDDLHEVGNEYAIRFGARETLFELQDLRIGRDIAYEGRQNIPEDKPLYIAPGNYVMMGDNVHNSHDSRLWEQHTFRLKDGQEIDAEIQEWVKVTDSEGRVSVEEKWKDDIDDLIQRKKLSNPPDYYIKADPDGNEHWFDKKDLQEHSSKGYIFVESRFIVGKAFWVWWPPGNWPSLFKGRWFRLIR